ncbi:MAG TPA: hypothetical protein VFL36_22835 [Myxococcales bacterium]|nr:hypothetical protein [Myxococcales bacterium]
MQDRILVVDDDADVRDTLYERLDTRGYEVEVAEHGKAALELLISGFVPPLFFWIS